MKEATDIIVVGAGVAGFAAAIAASEEGKKVVLLEKNHSIGGNAIQSNVGTICGAYYQAESEKMTAIKHPLLNQLISDLNLKPLNYHKNLVVLPYNVNELHRWMLAKLKKHRVDLFCGAEISNVHVKVGRITSVEVSVGKTQKQILAQSFIDASGDASLSELAGLKTISSANYQPASQVFQVKNTSVQNEFSSNFAIRKELMKHASAQNWPESHLSLSIVPGSLHAGKADLKFILPTTISDQTKQADLDAEGSTLAKELFGFLKAAVPSFSDAELNRIYPQAGIRVLKRSKGRHILTEADLLANSPKKQPAAIGTWPMEIWQANGKVELHNLSEAGFYHIPKKCLLSDQLENLFFAGKNISATDRAIASARVIGTCIQTGYSAGKMASEFC